MKTYKVVVQCLADVVVEVNAISEERAVQMACEATQNMLLDNYEKLEVEGKNVYAWVEELINPLVTSVDGSEQLSAEVASE